MFTTIKHRNQTDRVISITIKLKYRCVLKRKKEGRSHICLNVELHKKGNSTAMENHFTCVTNHHCQRSLKKNNLIDNSYDIEKPSKSTNISHPIADS